MRVHWFPGDCRYDQDMMRGCMLHVMPYIDHVSIGRPGRVMTREDWCTLLAISDLD